MEEAIRKELNQLCREILSDPAQDTSDELIAKVRLLEEKLVLLKYLKYRSSEMDKSSVQRVDNYDHELKKVLEDSENSKQEADKRAEESKASEIQFVPAEPRETSGIAEPAQATESPVDIQKMQADKTPEQLTEIAMNREIGSSASTGQATNKYLAGQIKLGLNDRLAFTNNLFEGSQEDLNRVISQINTFDSYPEAEAFLLEMVKPDYNWGDKSEYEERLFELVKARFGEA